eukprot:CAMPEP_0184688528 /NCGR_PEP_ID=MMETSP0312-20130426/30147_1 /TAXON_ID=31354 /ORGANISM="Compsopogon coeruleus, Strain SAG 36.94" /LENGTH=475 /DNA_ID=CAMNT_0027145775 /DNA_START=123 /DNA_END=1550 /DNA_ORIENTATION=-
MNHDGVDIHCGAPVELNLNLEIDPVKMRGRLAGGGMFLSPLPSVQNGDGSTFPMVLRMPDGNDRQLDIPHTATVGDVKHRLRTDMGIPWDMDLSFPSHEDGSAALDDNALLSRYHIPEAYQIGGALLWTIDDAQLPPYARAEAVRVANEVVKNVSIGVRDSEELACRALQGTDDQQQTLEKVNGPREFVAPDEEQYSPNSLDMVPGVKKSDPFHHGSNVVDPTHVVQLLSDKLPCLFTPAARDEFSNAWTLGTPTLPPSSARQRGTLTHPEEVAVPQNSNANWIDDLCSIWSDPRMSVPEPRNPGNGFLDALEDGNVDCNHTAKGTSSVEEEDKGHYVDSNDEEIDDCDDDPLEEMNAALGVSLPTASVAQAPQALEDQVAKATGRSPRKRGRKRKFPHLTEEERRTMRRDRNRESARRSRDRKRNIQKQYESKITAVRKENDSLEGQVSALSNRLEFLKQILTVHVRSRSAESR